MRPFKRLLSREVAMEIIRENIRRVDRVERVPLDKAAGRVLAEDLAAGFDVPSFDRSAMDGYAVRAEDTYGSSTFSPKRLKLIGELHAVDQLDGEVGPGECVQVATGSPVPRGSDAIVMVEYTKLNGDEVKVQSPVYPGANISSRGEDMKEGETVVKGGEWLSPGKVGAIAAQGVESVKVYNRPSVAIVSTGSEVRPIRAKLEPGQIFDINSYTLSAVVSANGCIPRQLGIVSDDYASIEKVLREAVGCDIVVFSGGSSVGSRDLLYDVVEEAGEVLFHGLQVKPGKPTLFAVVEEKPVFGMPGYPTSCLSNAVVFLIPALRIMAGLPPHEPKRVKAKMAARVVSSSGREQFLTVRLEDGFAYPVFKKSGAITSMARADGYIFLPVNLDTVEEGEEVMVTLLG
jgi:molybdenum cofactor synthesis domain-containing protein